MNKGGGPLVAFWRKDKQRDEAQDARWIIIVSPVSGRVMPLEEVDDPVFSGRMIGDGVAILPDASEVNSPVAGTLTNLFPTGHAVGITTAEGIEVLVHVGLDTVELKGQGFTKLAHQGQKVVEGTELLRLDLDVLRERARSLATPVLVTTMDKVQQLQVMAPVHVHVQAGRDELFRIQLKP